MLRGEAFSWKPTKESSKNIDFAIDKPPQCLTINTFPKFPLNSTNCEEGNLYITRLDEQLKEIQKCHHQNYINAKTLNNISKSGCLEEKWGLLAEKITIKFKLALNLK